MSPGRRICPEKKKKANTPDKTETGQPLDHYISHTSLVKENNMLIINTTTEDKMANTIVIRSDSNKFGMTRTGK